MERTLGLDVHAQSCTLAVVSEAGRWLKDVVVETNGQALVEAMRTIPGRKHLCIEEGTQSEWLYEILSPHVDEMLVVGIRQSRGQKSDRGDAYERAEELRRGVLGPRVFKAPSSFALLRELTKSHRSTSRDRVRIQARLKSVYRGRGIATPGARVYGERQRGDWLQKLPVPQRRRAQRLYAQLDFGVEQERQAVEDLVRELRRHPMAKILETCPGLGPIRVARLVSVVVTPHRFRTRQQFWSYCGLGIVMRSSSDWVHTPAAGWTRASVMQTRGLSRQHNAVLKDVFKGAATTVIMQLPEALLHADYRRMLEHGTKPNLTKLTLARKIASTTLAMWKHEEAYSPKIAHPISAGARDS